MVQTFKVSGMHCQHCVGAVTRAIREIDPAAEVSVALETGAVAIGSAAEPAKLAEAIRKAGYDVT